MTRSVASPRTPPAPLTEWIRPQLTQLVDAASDGPGWLHEIKFDGYRMQARLDRGAVRLLTRTGLDWTHKYPAIADAVASIGATQAYLDGELCGVRPDGVTSFSMIQLASDSGNAAALVFFLFDLLHLDGEDLCPLPPFERKERLAALLAEASSPLHTSDHQVGHGRAFHEKACAMALEGIVSKRADAAYAPGNRGLWVKVKCLHREEFIVVGWTDPAGSRPWLGALLLAYYDPDGRLVYAGRAGTGIKQAELERLWQRLQPLAVGNAARGAATAHRPLRIAPGFEPGALGAARAGRRSQILTWTDDNLLRQVVYEGLREDKPAAEVRRSVPHPKPVAATSTDVRSPRPRR
jgi:DNA ligase D-like protein (predicted ligase)